MLEALFLSQFGTAALNPNINTADYQESQRDRRNIDALPTLGAEVCRRFLTVIRILISHGYPGVHRREPA
jgi:hypothetical protein